MARISRAIPLDQLRQPETDVRERRAEDDIMSLAASMGDPNVGQLQDILVHPVEPDELEGDMTDDRLDELFRDDHPLRIVDGETRRLAAEKLGWATLDATIVPEPPESTVVAQLDANTERIEMGEAETVRALFTHYQETELTLEDMADKVGYSRSYLSNVFGLCKAPEWLQEPWRNPDHPLGTSHALALKSLLTENSLEGYQRGGGLDEEEAYQRAESDARLMIDVQAEHELPVGEFRKRTKRCRKETIDQLEDQRDLEEKRADGQADAAETEVRTGPGPEPPELDCMVCGNEADRKIALDVCREDYGMLSEMKANGEVLMAQAEGSNAQPAVNAGANGGASDAAEALAAATGIDPRQAEQVVEQVQQEASQGGQ